MALTAPPQGYAPPHPRWRLRGLSKSPVDRLASAAAFRDALLAREVPPWTHEDARAWWRIHGERLPHRATPARAGAASAGEGLLVNSATVSRVHGPAPDEAA